MKPNPPTHFFFVLLFVTFSQLVAFAQEGLPNGWTRGGSAPINYQITVDETVKHSGKASANIQFIGTAANGFVTLTQICQAEAYRGKRVRFSAWVKTDAPGDHAQLWFRLDAPTRMPGFDNMAGRPIKGRTDWKPYELVLEVPDDVAQLVFGLMSFGTGRVWLDDVKLEVVGNEVAVTNTLTPEAMSAPRNNSALASAKLLPARNLDFEGGFVPLRQPVTVNPAVYDALRGAYINTVGRVLTVTKEANKLFIADSFGPKGEALPQSESEYFIRNVDGTFVFRPRELLLRVGNNEARFQQINLVEAKTRGEQILALARQAKGGQDKLAAVRDLYFEATRIIDGTKTEHLNFYLSAQWEYRQESTDAKTGAVDLSFSDGKILQASNAAGTREIPSLSLDHIRRLIWLNFTLHPVAADTLEVWALDDAQVNGAPVNVLLARTGNERYLLSFDANTHLLRRLRHPQSGLDYVYEDFRAVNGLQFPFKATILVSGRTVAVTFHTFKINGGIAPAKLIQP